MLRVVSAAVRGIAARTNLAAVTNSAVSAQHSFTNYAQNRCFGALSSAIQTWSDIGKNHQKLLGSTVNQNINSSLISPPITTPVRTVTKFSLRKGKRKTVHAVLKRFFRLHWGIWIRTRAGRNKHLWRKTESRRRRLRQHVFVNSTQSHMLDKMVTKYWRRPHYYVDDPYAPYHVREEFMHTRKKPAPK